MQGIVLQTTGSWYRILCEDGIERDARLKGRFRQEGLRFTNPIAVGDHVDLKDADDSEGTVISRIGDRKNYIVRQSPRKKFHQHIIASNIDQALLMVSIRQPRTSTGFIDRFLAAAESFHIPVRILINKTDLLRKKDEAVLEDWQSVYGDLDYEVYTASIEKEEGLDAVNDLLNGKVTLLAGHSGVGKSSLINHIAPGLDLKVSELSVKHEKGRHTTTYATMHKLTGGQFDTDTFIIDTPGLKEFGLSQIEPEELSGYFVEMKALVGECRFHNCLHRNEPGCAVRDAVSSGDIAGSRYVNYIQMLESLEAINSWERD